MSSLNSQNVPGRARAFLPAASPGALPNMMEYKRPRSNALPWRLLIAALLSLSSATAAPAALKAVHPERGEITRYVSLPGELRANQQATLYAKVGGYLKTLSVDKGDRVSSGQLLAEIEVPELIAEVARRKAEVKVAEVEAERLRGAAKKAPDLVTPQSVDEAEARLEIARANLQHTQTLLNYARVTAPFTGIVTARFLDPGAFVPAATAGSVAQNAALVTVADFNIIRVQVALPETEARLAKVGQPVLVQLHAMPEHNIPAQLSRLSYALDESTRTMLAEADVPNPKLELLPGMYVTARVGLEKHDHALLVPAEALVMEKTTAFVFIAQDGKAKKTAIKTGFNDGSKVEVLSGLTGSETVLLAGKTPPADGAPVQVEEVR